MDNGFEKAFQAITFLTSTSNDYSSSSTTEPIHNDYSPSSTQIRWLLVARTHFSLFSHGFGVHKSLSYNQLKTKT